MEFILVVLYLVAMAQVLSLQTCQQDVNCNLPDCLCSSFSHQGNPRNYPQIVYFGFDDALTASMAVHYRDLFSPDRKNPNNCPIGMSLYIQHNYTDYNIVREMYKKGMEIGVHSVTHQNIDDKAKLLKEATQQRLNLHKLGNVPLEEILGWRSPNLKTAGDDQPDILKQIGYTYDISLTYARRSYGEKKAFPYSLDYGNPLPCMVTPCPKRGSPHRGFWEIPINSLLDYKNEYPCPYVDGCHNGPRSENEAFKYLYRNFVDYYENDKEPLGFHMHAAWFVNRQNKKAMNRFIKYMVSLPDVYIVTAKQMLDWVRHPVPLLELHTLPTWSCSSRKSPGTLPPLKIDIPTNQILKPPNSLASKRKPSTMKPLRVMTSKPFVRYTTTTPRTRRSTPPTKPQTTIRVYWQRRTQRPPYRSPFAPQKAAVSAIGSQGNRAMGTRNSFKPVRQQTIAPPRRPLSRRTTTERITTKTQIMTMAPARSPGRNRSPFTPIARPGNQSGNQRYTPQNSQNGSTHTTGSWNTNQCNQGRNCFLPDCFCRTMTTPLGLALSDTPQLVYFAFDGPVDGRVYAEYVRMFDKSRRNADGCPISATLFVAKDGNYMTYLRNLANRGFDIALRGGHHGAYINGKIMELDLDQELRTFQQHMSNISFRGWRSPSSRSLADEQFQLISSRNLKYDSSLILRSDDGASRMAFPYTLDFGWKDKCYTTAGCPQNKYPGLWEIPVYTLKDYLGQYICIYADGCMQNPVTEEQTFQFLLRNFNRHYYGNKAPFGINLRHLWFSHYIYIPNKVGLDRFIRYIVEMQDVYILNVNQVIDWMRNPTALSQLQSYQPWICSPGFY